MTQPIVHDYLTQIFAKHYGRPPKAAAEEAHRFLEIVDLYGMELIVGDWREQMKEPKSRWDEMLEIANESADREPWKAYEIN